MYPNQRARAFRDIRDSVVNINGGTFIDVRGDYRHHSGSQDAESGLFALNCAISHGATYDSAERCPAPTCYPGTHTVVLKAILKWINDPSPDGDILWLNGPEKGGKSAIMQTIAEILSEGHRERYAGSFFFATAGVSGQNQSRALFSTLAYQIAMHVPGMREPINAAMMVDPSLPTKSMDIQFQSLIVTPFVNGSYPPNWHTPTIIIDGLDKCHGSHNQKTILSLIGEVQPDRRLPLRFLIASRPEFWIRDSFEQQPLLDAAHRINLGKPPSSLDDAREVLSGGIEALEGVIAKVMRHV